MQLLRWEGLYELGIVVHLEEAEKLRGKSLRGIASVDSLTVSTWVRWSVVPVVDGVTPGSGQGDGSDTVKIVLLHGVCSSKILCIYTIMQLRRTLLLVTHCDLLRGVTDNPVLQSCLSRVLDFLLFNLALH